MKNIIVVGDSFCSNPLGWPTTLANELNLNLICHGEGGQPWWNARNFLTNLTPNTIDNTEIIVFAHTNKDRLPTANRDIGLVDHSKPPTTEIEQAIHLYYKYIQDSMFLEWAHRQWFLEISRLWGNKKLCHLHCFPWTLQADELLTGLNVKTNLVALSLNELGIKQCNLFEDTRANHLNTHNNLQLGLQLAEQLKHYSNRSVNLDVTKFDQTISYWLDIGENWPL